MDCSVNIGDMDTSVSIPETWLATRSQILDLAKPIEAVKDQDEFEKAAAVVAKTTTISNQLEKQRLEFAKPFNHAAREIKKLCDEWRADLETEKKRIKKLCDKYAAKQAKKQREAQRRAAEEERRRAEEAFAAQQAEQAALDDLGIDEQPAPEPIEVAPVPAPYVEAAHSTAVRMPVNIKYEIVDLDKIPRAFMSIDTRKVNEYIRDNKATLKANLEDELGVKKEVVPGMMCWAEINVTGRGRG